MQGKRGKNYVKKFVLIPSKYEFDKIPYTRSQYFYEKKYKNEYEIIVPKFEQITPIVEKKGNKIGMNYVKSFRIKYTMGEYKYEIDSVDRCYLDYHCPFIYENLFAKILVKLEIYSQKKENYFNYQKVIKKVISSTSLVFEKGKILSLAKSIFFYWKNKRKMMCSPLLRKFWTKTEVGPFKNRYYDGNRGLRNRVVKVDHEEVREILLYDLLFLKKILLKMKYREQLERKLLNQQKYFFEKSCQKVFKKINIEYNSNTAKQNKTKAKSKLKTRYKKKPLKSYKKIMFLKPLHVYITQFLSYISEVGSYKSLKSTITTTTAKIKQEVYKIVPYTPEKYILRDDLYKI